MRERFTVEKRGREYHVIIGTIGGVTVAGTGKSREKAEEHARELNGMAPKELGEYIGGLVTLMWRDMAKSDVQPKPLPSVPTAQHRQ